MEKLKNNDIKLQNRDTWKVLKTTEIINLKETLFSGQIFNFYQTEENEYTGSIYFFIVSFKTYDKKLFYRILHSKITNENLIERCLHRFFTLSIKYESLIKEKYFLGLRLITNSLIPTIFSFICSANNNIKRITKMVLFLYSKGEFAIEYKNFKFFYFPSLSKLINITEELQENGFGYRSKYICKTAEYLLKNDDFASIRDFDDKVLDNEIDLDSKYIANLLIKLPGIGQKVRDCILLMGVGQYEIVPIDTHIFKHAKKKFNLFDKKLTVRNYKTIQDNYINCYGLYAGIYQLYIFKDYIDKKFN